MFQRWLNGMGSIENCIWKWNIILENLEVTVTVGTGQDYLGSKKTFVCSSHE